MMLYHKMSLIVPVDSPLFKTIMEGAGCEIKDGNWLYRKEIQSQLPKTEIGVGPITFMLKTIWFNYDENNTMYLTTEWEEARK